MPALELEPFTGDKLGGGAGKHWRLLFLNNNFTEIQFIEHKVHSFHVYNSVIWGLLSVVDPNTVNSRTFLSPQFEILYL